MVVGEAWVLRLLVSCDGINPVAWLAVDGSCNHAICATLQEVFSVKRSPRVLSEYIYSQRVKFL